MTTDAGASGTGTRPTEALDAGAARRWALVTRAALSAHRGELDALNVFPVPDGDTGTNLSLTFDTALEHTWAALGEHSTLPQLVEELARAMLLSARGNSGVILSQVFRGLADEVLGRPVVDLPGSDHPPVELLDAVGLARALRRGSDLAWRSVFRPREGTILSVAEAAAVAAAEVVTQRPDVPLAVVVRTALASSREALARTPEQLVELARAGVVDAGGAGFVLLLEALARVVLGEPVSAPAAPQARPLGAPVAAFALTAHEYTTGPAYEVMYLLESSDERAVGRLRERLDALGDSVLVVGDAAEGVWSVHAHVDDIGAAIEAGIDAGRPRSIHVTRFADQIEEHHGAHLAANATPTAAAPRADLGLVAGVGGDGLIEAFRAAGAVVVPSRPRRRASVAQLLDACRATAASEVILLSADADLELAARAAAAAAAGEGITVEVVAVSSPVQGLAALAVFDPGHLLAPTVEAMADAAAATAYGAVTIAAREPGSPQEVWRRGDILGVVRGEITHVGADLATVGRQVLRSLLQGVGSRAEVVTLVAGADAPGGLVDTVAEVAAEQGLETITVDGGQPVIHLHIGVE